MTPAKPHFARTLLLTISVLVLFGWLVIRYSGLLIAAKVPTSSMEPTIPRNSVVTVDNLTYLFRSPQRGEIVWYKTAGLPEQPSDSQFLKRVIGLPGEHLVISNGIVFINDVQTSFTNQTGPLLFPNHPLLGGSTFVTNLVIPPNTYFVIGDNSTNSIDSRIHGPVPRANIMGRMLE